MHNEHIKLKDIKLNDIKLKLNELGNNHLLRRDVIYPCGGAIVEINGCQYSNLSSNDYLNLAHHEEVKVAAAEAIMSYGASSSASRLVTGTLSLHNECEQNLATLVGSPASLVCGSGYLANLCMLTSMVGRHDIVFADKLVHASLIDGVHLSGAKLIRFRHNDLSDLASLLYKANLKRKTEEQFVVLTESVFSMDGDLAPLGDLYELANQFDASMLIDDAHALGVFGDAGGGYVPQILSNNSTWSDNATSTPIAMVSATLSKALGSYGGVLFCNEIYRKWLINNARPFIYNTSLPPSAIAAANAAMRVIKREKNLGQILLNRSSKFREMLRNAGFNTANSVSQIIPIIVGDNERVLRFSHALKEAGILGVAIRSPTVPVNTARIRFSMTLGFSDQEVEALALKIIEVAQNQRLI